MVRSLLGAALIFLAAPMDVGVASDQQPTIQGAWNARVYRLASGQVHTVRGRIFFADTEWQVLFFVMDNDEPRRGSGEGGTYTLRGDQLTFEHHYLLAAGDEMLRVTRHVPAHGSSRWNRAIRTDAHRTHRRPTDSPFSQWELFGVHGFVTLTP